MKQDINALDCLTKVWISPFSWYTLDSKPGKKCKERGRIQVSIQFTRNNKTSSMFELSVQSKPRSPFFKLKDKMKGCKQHSGNFSDSSSALPSFGPCSSIAKPQHQGSEHPTQLQSEPEPIQSLLVRKHKLSAAQSLSDLIGSNFCSKMDSASGKVHCDCLVKVQVMGVCTVNLSNPGTPSCLTKIEMIQQWRDGVVLVLKCSNLMVSEN